MSHVNSYIDDTEGVTVEGFDVPDSPDSSYNNLYSEMEDEAHEPPSVPLQLQHTLLSSPASGVTADALAPPLHVGLNHLYKENREASRPVTALGFTHRFQSKFVTVVLYKPVLRKGDGVR